MNEDTPEFIMGILLRLIDEGVTADQILLASSTLMFTETVIERITELEYEPDDKVTQKFNEIENAAKNLADHYLSLRFTNELDRKLVILSAMAYIYSNGLMPKFESQDNGSTLYFGINNYRDADANGNYSLDDILKDITRKYGEEDE